MTSPIRLAAFAVASVFCSAFAVYTAPLNAASFQVELKRLSAVQCGLTGSLLTVDANTGNVTIDLDADANCYPAPINALNLNASLLITTPLSVGGGTTGEGTVGLQLNTGLTAPTSGVTCVSDGVVATNVNITSGWPATLCTNCGPTATASVGVQHAGLVGNGSISFMAKCTYQDPAHPNLQTVRSNIQTASIVTVTPGTIPTPTACTSVSQLATSNGLTPAQRVLSSSVTALGSAPVVKSHLEYTSIFGTSANTFPVGSADTTGYGFPGTDKRTMEIVLDRGKYISWKFRAPSDPAWLERAGNFVPSSFSTYTTLAIAPCPGQFATDANWPASPFCVWEPKSNPKWRVRTAGGGGAECKLEPGKIYHFNVIQAGLDDLTNATCTGASCRFQVRSDHSY